MLINTIARQTTNLRGLFAGAGADGLSNPLMVRQVLKLLPLELRQPSCRSEMNVLYVGTATYDLQVRREQQTRCFVDEGCTVDSLDVALNDPQLEDCVSKIERADVIVVGGGNTLFAVDRWRHLGLIPHFRNAMQRDCVLTGGSAGAICWFHSGHSDSADPDTYAEAMLRKYGDNPQTGDESSTFDASNRKEWNYLRVPGMGFVPGNMICCPHHDRVQSNGLLRANDFDTMLLKRAAALASAKSENQPPQTELIGIGIDHFAAFVVEGSRYKVYSLPDKAGSIGSKERFAVRDDGTAQGVPGVWIKRVDLTARDGKEPTVRATICPEEGDLMDLLGEDIMFREEVAFEDDDDEENRRALENCRRGNPSMTIRA